MAKSWKNIEKYIFYKMKICISITLDNFLEKLIHTNKKTENFFSVLVALNILFVSLSQSINRFYEIFILFNRFIRQNKKQNS